MKDAITISIIIPTFNEAENITGLIRNLQQHKQDENIEIIIADGRSTDNTRALATRAGATVLICATRGRALQMNFGAFYAKGNVLYFLHADSIPPRNFDQLILTEVKNGCSMGCFRLKFDLENTFLKANAWFTRFDYNAFRFGDQSLFVLKDIFVKAGGFDEKLVLMEDQEIIRRLKRFGKFKVLPESIITSARKYRVNGIYKTQAIFLLVYFLYKIGVPQHILADLYRKTIKQDKI